MVGPLPSYETSDRPWFGPTARAKRHLAERTHVLGPKDALHKLVAVLGSDAVAVQHVRFIDFRHRDKKNFRFTIALCWTDSDNGVRDALYDYAREIVSRTGWYPLPQGERLGSRKQSSDAYRKLMSHEPGLPELGRLMSVENATRTLSCAIRVRTDRGSILLDVGFPDAVVMESSDRAVFLSHVHRDHAGGLQDPGLRDLPVIASEGTTRSLIRPGQLSLDEAAQRFAITAPGKTRRLGALDVTTFTVPHCPGAAGVRLADGSTSLYFPGDVLLRTARHNFVGTLVSRIAEDPSRRRVVLLDATMAGRSEGATGHDTGRTLVDATASESDVVVLADDHSQLLYAYLDLFHVVKATDARGTVAFVMSGSVRRLAQLLHDAFMARRLDHVDPLIAGQYGREMSAWGESRWLFWLDHVRAPVRASRRIWLVLREEISRVLQTAVGVTVGRTEPEALDGRTALTVDTTPWTQHSVASTVAETVHALGPHAEVLLFHAPGRKLRRFIRDESFTNCAPLTTEPVALRGRTEVA